MTRGWLRGALILAVTFAAGTMAGIAYDRHHAAPAMRMPNAQQLVQHLKDQLSLDSAQERQVAGIMAHHQYTVDSAWRAIQPHVGVALDSMIGDVMAVLRPDQTEKFQRLIRQMHPAMHPIAPRSAPNATSPR